jgi:uncharacterized protein with HEPN domain
MNSSDIQRLQHIKTYCEDVAEAMNRFGPNYNTFIQDKDYFNSVSMSMMQIGELSGKLSSEFKSETYDKMQWGAIQGMRNLFVHAYASMNKEVIWESAIHDIPSLLKFCDKVIAKAIGISMEGEEKNAPEEGKGVMDRLNDAWGDRGGSTTGQTVRK